VISNHVKTLSRTGDAGGAMRSRNRPKATGLKKRGKVSLVTDPKGFSGVIDRCRVLPLVRTKRGFGLVGFLFRRGNCEKGKKTLYGRCLAKLALDSEGEEERRGFRGGGGGGK